MKESYEAMTQRISNAIVQIESNKVRVREIQSESYELKCDIVRDILTDMNVVDEVLREIPIGVLMSTFKRIQRKYR